MTTSITLVLFLDGRPKNLLRVLMALVTPFFGCNIRLSGYQGILSTAFVYSALTNP